MIDELRLRRILASRKKVKEPGRRIPFMHYPTGWEKERPYYPKIFLILDGSTGLILRHELMKIYGMMATFVLKPSFNWWVIKVCFPPGSWLNVRKPITCWKMHVAS